MHLLIRKLNWGKETEFQTEKPPKKKKGGTPPPTAPPPLSSLVWGQIQVLAVKPSSFSALQLWLLLGCGGFAFWAKLLG